MNSANDIPMPLRLLLAVSIAPLAGSFVGALMMGLPMAFGYYDSVLVVLPFLIAGCYFAYPIAIVLGVPIHLILVRRKIGSLAVYLLIGAVFGSIVGGVVFVAGTLNLYGASFPLVSAIIGAGLFWRIAVPRLSRAAIEL
jgi:hypothetical protein